MFMSNVITNEALEKALVVVVVSIAEIMKIILIICAYRNDEAKLI